MHETGIVRGLVRQLERVTREAGAERVSRVTVWLGALSQFSEHHFREHFDDESPGTCAEGAELVVEVSDDVSHPDAQAVVIRSVDVDVAGDGD